MFPWIAFSTIVGSFITRDVDGKFNAYDLHTAISNEQNISSRFSSNSEANASELLENFVEMIPLYNIHSSMPKSSITPYGAIRREKGYLLLLLHSTLNMSLGLCYEENISLLNRHRVVKKLIVINLLTCHFDKIFESDISSGLLFSYTMNAPTF